MRRGLEGYYGLAGEKGGQLGAEVETNDGYRIYPGSRIDKTSWP